MLPEPRGVFLFFVSLLSTITLYLFLAFSGGAKESSEIEALAPYEVFVDGLKEPVGIVVREDGTVYVSDRKAGVVHEVRDGEASPSVKGLKSPWGMALDDAGRLLIVERNRGRLLRLEDDGSLTVLARRMKKPQWVTIGRDGNIYISARGLRNKEDRDKDEESEEEDHKHKGEMILRLTDAGELSVWKDGFKDLGGLVALEGAIYAIARRHREVRQRRDKREGIYKVHIEADGTAGEISLYAGGIEEGEGLAGDDLGAFYVSAEKIRGKKKGKRKEEIIGKALSDGTVVHFALGLEDPRGLALDSFGDLYVAVEKLPEDHHRSPKNRKRRNKKGGILRFRAPLPPALEVTPYTNQNPLHLTGISEPNSRIDLLSNDSSDPISVFTEDGSFSLDWELKRNAENTATLWSTDQEGLGLTSPPVEIKTVHDDIVPTVVFLEPPTGRPVRGGIEIAARAGDGGSGIGSFEIRAGGELLTSALIPPPPAGSVDATAIWNTFSFPDGTFSVNATGFDQAGNSRTTTRLILVDNTPPETLISAGPEGTVSGTSFTFSVAGTDNLARPEELEFSWRIDGGPFSAFRSETEIPLSNLAPGPHAFEVKALDPAGNEDPTPAKRAFTVSALSVQITDPTDGAAVPEGSLLVHGAIRGSGDEVGVIVNGFPAAVQGNTFTALVPVTPETTILSVVATSSSGATANQAIGISVLPTAVAPAVLLPSPEGGVAPLAVSFFLLGGPAPASVELDFDGDGSIDFSGANLEGQAFTYTQPGIYTPTVTVTDGQGNEFVSQALVHAYDPVALDTILQSKWTGMKDELRSGDIAASLGFLVPRSRARYEEAFRIIEASLPGIDAILTDITLLRVRGRSAIYEASRIDDGLPKSFELRFALDEDGIWRIEAF